MEGAQGGGIVQLDAPTGTVEVFAKEAGAECYLVVVTPTNEVNHPFPLLRQIFKRAFGGDNWLIFICDLINDFEQTTPRQLRAGTGEIIGLMGRSSVGPYMVRAWQRGRGGPWYCRGT